MNKIVFTAFLVQVTVLFSMVAIFIFSFPLPKAFPGVSLASQAQ